MNNQDDKLLTLVLKKGEESPDLENKNYHFKIVRCLIGTIEDFKLNVSWSIPEGNIDDPINLASEFIEKNVKKTEAKYDKKFYFSNPNINQMAIKVIPITSIDDYHIIIGYEFIP